jgi:hypothetical protein
MHQRSNVLFSTVFTKRKKKHPAEHLTYIAPGIDQVSISFIGIPLYKIDPLAHHTFVTTVEQS